MDRRQRKTREAIFSAFIDLLAQVDLNQITVSMIIERADVGRATFYSHFETRDYLLKELCEDLFCHIFDAIDDTYDTREPHRHMFHGDAPESAFLHLFRHLLKNDNHILDLLSCRNNDMFLQYFQQELNKLVTVQLPAFAERKHPSLPDSFWIRHISSTFVDTLRWWIDQGMTESPETICNYFYLAI